EILIHLDYGELKMPITFHAGTIQNQMSFCTKQLKHQMLLNKTFVRKHIQSGSSYSQKIYLPYFFSHKTVYGHIMNACMVRSEEHTSELQSRFDLVCRLLLEKKKKTDET